MNTFKLVISTPLGTLFDDEVKKLSLRGSEGELAVMAKHIPFVTLVKPCECRVELKDGSVKVLKIEDGVLNVSPSSANLVSGNLMWL